MDLNEEFQINDVIHEDLFKYVQDDDQIDIEKTDPDVKIETPSVNIGLTTKQANIRFIKILTEILGKCERKISYRLLLLELRKFDLILTLVSVLFLLGSFIYVSLLEDQKETISDLWEYVFELLILIPWILLNIYVKILIKINNINRKSNRIREILEFLNFNLNVNANELENKNYNLDPPSSEFVSIYRDYRWIRLPKNVIVKGDIFKLNPNETFPCECKLLIDYKNNELITSDEVYKEGEICKYIGTNTENQTFIDGTYVALNDSCRRYLDYYVNNFNNEHNNEYKQGEKNNDFSNYYGFKFRNKDKKQVIWNYNDNYMFLNNNNKIIIIVIIVLSVILNILWSYLFSIQNNVTLLIYTARMVMLLDFIGLYPLYKLSELWGNVKLLSIFEIYHEHKFLKGLDSIRSVSSSSFLTDSSYDSERSDVLVNEITYSFQIKQVKRVLKKGLFDEYSLINHLSCITLLSFIDDIGILFNSNQSLQEISIITKRNSSINKEPPEKNEGEQDNVLVKMSSNYYPVEHYETVNTIAEVNRIDTNLYGDIGDIYVEGELEKDVEGGEDDLLILDVFNDTNLYGKDNIRFTNEHEKNCRNQLKPLVFSMSLTSLPSCVPLFMYKIRTLKKNISNPNPSDMATPRIDTMDGADNIVGLSVDASVNAAGNGNTSTNFFTNSYIDPISSSNINTNPITNSNHIVDSGNCSLSVNGQPNPNGNDADYNSPGINHNPASIQGSKPHTVEFESTNRRGDEASKGFREAYPGEYGDANRPNEVSVKVDESSKLDGFTKLEQPTSKAESKPPPKIYGRKGLYKNYISSLINSDLDSFNNCLCTLTNVLGIKKLYLKRYKLLKFVLFNYTSSLKENSWSSSNPDKNAAATSATDANDSSRPNKYKKLMSEEDKMENEDNKILIYFYRDINKKIIQMLIKCRISVINNYKLNYYNGTKIMNLNKRIKRKIKDLNMQWLSNGMSTFLYFYKPISINDFNIFLFLLPYISVYNISLSNFKDKFKDNITKSKLNLVKKNEKYMFLYKHNPLYYKYKGVNIRQLSKAYKTNLLQNNLKNEPQPKSIDSSILNKEKVSKDVVLGSYVGKMLNSYIKNSILLGMVATRHNLPKELSNRIHELHDAGIRFVYFSKHNEKITRIIGGLLGLETSWNSMISLSASETTSFINQEGHTVLPNGIHNIRQHIQHVDDIPLQVSLYCNCNCDSIVEMLDILDENGERIMCIGSGLNPNNFYLFNNSHISFSISLNYNPICKFCRGKRWQGISKAHIFEEPKPEFKLSSLITSLTCSLQTTQLYKVSDPDFIFDMLFELFKEARKIATNLQESISFMILSYYSLVWMYFFQHLLSLPPILTTFDFSLIVFVYIPLLSLTLISNPVMDRIMEHLPNKIIQNSRITFNHYVRTYLRLLVTSVFVVSIYYIHIYYTNLHIDEKYLLNNQFCKHFLYYPRYRCVDSVIKFLNKGKEYDKYVCIILSQNYTSISLVVFLVTTSLSWIHKYSYINLDTFKNIKWMIAVAIILSLQISVVAVKMVLLDLRDYKLMRMMIVNTSYTLLLTVPILLVDQIVKFFIIKNKNTQQKFLKLLFSTRLGTWSPK